MPRRSSRSTPRRRDRRSSFVSDVAMQTRESVGPEGAVLFGPPMDSEERLRVQAVDAQKSVGAPLDETGPLQNLEVLRHRRVRKADLFDQGTHRPFARA